MVTPLEPTPVVSLDTAIVYAQDVGLEQYDRGRASRQPEIDTLLTQVTNANLPADAIAAQFDTVAADRDRIRREYADHMATAHPTPPPPDPEPQPHRVIMGMSSPAGEWDQRVTDVGPGLGARRIFADLDNGITDKADLIEDALAAGLIPVISYKGTPTPTKLTQLSNYLAAYDTELTATYWHEPWGDFTDYSVFRARSAVFLDAVQGPDVKVGPFLNGWLLNRRVADFKSLTTPDLLARWDFLGIDTYEEGTLAAPGAIKPASRIPLLEQFARDNGIPDKPLVVGEYNGYSAATIAAAGDAILASPTMWIACMWNSTEGKGYTLTGDRLTAFKRTLADPRVAR